MTDLAQGVAAALKNSASPALKALSPPRYPLRELRPRLQKDGKFILTVQKFGYGYKYHGKKPPSLSVVDTDGIMAALNSALGDNFRITMVTENEKNIILKGVFL